MRNMYIYRVQAAKNQIEEMRKDAEKDLQKLCKIRSDLVRLREVFITWQTVRENIETQKHRRVSSKRAQLISNI